MKYDRMKLRHALFAIDSKYKKQKAYKDDESDLDDDDIAEHEESLKVKEIERVQKKFAKENEKLQEDGKKPQPDSVLKERLKEVDDEYKKLKKERGTNKAAFARARPVEKIEEMISKLDERMKTFKLQMLDREAGKEVALTTRYVPHVFWRVFERY